MYAALVLIVLLSAPAATQPTQLDTPESAAAAYERKEYAECGQMYRRMAKHAAPIQNLYNAASCFALAGDPEAAFAALDELASNGYPNTKRLRDDEDFASLRTTTRWTDLVAHVQANWDQKFGADNRELWALREGDEDDRRPGVDAKEGAERDHRRAARVREIVAAGGLKTSTDYFNAAMLFQHSRVLEDLQQARALALKAAELDPTNARAKWLAAAALDRYLWQSGKPQIYGTQFHQVDNVWTIDPIDESAVTDAERARWNVPPLADAKKRAAAMNNGSH